MSLQLYSDLLNLALSQANVDLLVLVWRDSLMLDKTSLIELNELILEKLPYLREDLGMSQVEKESFPEFTKAYDEFIYSSQCKDTPTKCLLFFAQEGDLRNVRKAIKKGAEVSSDALYQAARGGNLRVVKYLLENYDLVLNEGLAGAAHGRHEKVITYFLRDEDIDLNYGLLGAARGGNRELVNSFIEKGVKNWNMGLEGAASGGSLELVIFFLEKGALNVEEAALAAAKYGQLELVKFFLSEDDRLEHLIENSEYVKDRLLEQAISGGHLELVKYLAVPDSELEEEYLFQLGYNRYSDILFYLIELGVGGLEYAVKGAVKAGNTNLVAELIEWSSNNLDGDEFQTMVERGLEGAIEGGNLELVKYLSEKAEYVDAELPTLVMKSGRTDIMRVILERLTVILDGNTDLSFELREVVETGDVEMAKLLFEFGGDPQVLLQEARLHENKKMEKLALSYM